MVVGVVIEVASMSDRIGNSFSNLTSSTSWMNRMNRVLGELDELD